MQMEHLVRRRSDGNLETPPRDDPSSMGNRSSQRTESVPKYRTVNINSASAKHLQVLKDRSSLREKNYRWSPVSTGK
jgi:hypothetical protein